MQSQHTESLNSSTQMLSTHTPCPKPLKHPKSKPEAQKPDVAVKSPKLPGRAQVRMAKQWVSMLSCGGAPFLSLGPQMQNQSNARSTSASEGRKGS